jgi:RNA polymerase sigma-70 factor (ECF subfamily)
MICGDVNMEFVRTTRQTLIQRLKDPKDDAAWSDFYQFYFEIISGWARQQGCNQTQADDIFQETMVCLLRKMQSFEYDPERGSFKAFLKSVVRSRVIDYFRKEGRYVAVSADEEGNDQTDLIRDEEADNSQAFDSHEDKIWIKSVLNQALRQAYKKIDQVTYKSFCLYVLEGLSVDEVSQRLGNLRPGTIYQQKSRFLKMVEKEFSELLTNLGESGANSFNNDSVFIRAVEDMVQNRPEYRETIIQNFESMKDFDRIELLRKAIQISPGIFRQPNLLVIDADNVRASRRFEITNDLSIGKDGKCDIILADDSVSGLHATLFSNYDCYSIKDENSANGIMVNSRPINGMCDLNDGDVISFSARHSALFCDA